MEIKEQIARRPGWTVVAGTAAIASIVGGMTLANASGNGRLPDSIRLQDTATYEAPTAQQSSVPMFSAPLVGVAFDSTFDSPLDGAPSPSSGGSRAAASASASASFDSPAVSAPTNNPGTQAMAPSSNSQVRGSSSPDTASFDTPPRTATVAGLSTDSFDSVPAQQPTAQSWGSGAFASSIESLSVDSPQTAPTQSPTAGAGSPDSPESFDSSFDSD